MKLNHDFFVKFCVLAMIVFIAGMFALAFLMEWNDYKCNRCQPIIEYIEVPGAVPDAAFRKHYEKGYKDALESLALLHLELSIQEERKTYGEMFEILYKRNGIK